MPQKVKTQYVYNIKHIIRTLSFLVESDQCEDGFLCDNVIGGAVCLHLYQLCDGFIHCIGKSDETQCGL